MKNYFNKTIKSDYQSIFQEMKNVLNNEGFTITSEVNIHDRLREEFQIDFKKFTILAAINNSFAKSTPGFDGENIAHTKCNFIIYELSAIETEIGCYNPIALNGFSDSITWGKTEKEIVKRIDSVMQQIEKSKSPVV